MIFLYYNILYSILYNTASLSSSCCNKIPWARWLKRQGIYFLTDLETRRPCLWPGYQHSQVLVRALFLVCRRPPSCCFLTWPSLSMCTWREGHVHILREMTVNDSWTANLFVLSHTARHTTEWLTALAHLVGQACESELQGFRSPKYHQYKFTLLAYFVLWISLTNVIFFAFIFDFTIFLFALLYCYRIRTEVF